MTTRKPLRICATIELITLATLLTNMTTFDAHTVAALTGPIHGFAWLYGVIATWRDAHSTGQRILLSAIPGVGGMLALRSLDRAGAQNPSPDRPYMASRPSPDLSVGAACSQGGAGDDLGAGRRTWPAPALRSSGPGRARTAGPEADFDLGPRALIAGRRLRRWKLESRSKGFRCHDRRRGGDPVRERDG